MIVIVYELRYKVSKLNVSPMYINLNDVVEGRSLIHWALTNMRLTIVITSCSPQNILGNLSQSNDDSSYDMKYSSNVQWLG